MIIKHSKSIEWMQLFFNCFYLGAGIARELWYTTRKGDVKHYHFLQLGYVVMERENDRFILGTLTILWLSLKLGWRIK